MKREVLEKMGIKKEDIDKIMEQNGKDIEAHKNQAEANAKDRDTLKTQLDGVNNKLKDLGDSDPEALKDEIGTLKDTIATNETAYKEELTTRSFDTLLNETISGAKGKSAKAIKALLDTETLKASKNQKTDVAAAIKSLSEKEAYLFTAEEKGGGTPSSVSTGGKHEEPGSTSSDSFIAAAMKGAGLDIGEDD